MRTRRGWMIALGLAVVASVTVLPAGGVVLLTETFHGATVSDPNWVSGSLAGSTSLAGQWESTPLAGCLTAGTAVAGTPIPGCTPTTPVDVGHGVLRLTPAKNNEVGFTLYNAPLSTAGGLDITFHQFQWAAAANGADGTSFFLVDGATSLTAPGQPGGSLGYASRPTPDLPGVANGLIGIGLDAFGNYSDSASLASANGCAAGTGVGSAGPGPLANRVAIRGPGNGTTGYCWLASSSAVTLRSNSATRPAHIAVRIVFDPSTAATRNVTVFLDGTQVLQVPAPAALIAATTFKFGFAASTGGQNDNHEVCCLSIGEAPPTVVTAPVVATPRLTG